MLEIPSQFQSILRMHLPYADSAELFADDDLAGLGLDSMGVVRLLADIEDAYSLVVPDEILDEGTFATVGTLWNALSVLTGAAEPVGTP